MSKTRITLKPEIDEQAISRIRTALNEVGAGEEITITIESADAHQAGPVVAVLEEHGFDYQP